jgi:outer membrane protein OmpA-like peptidoglycan-associated protein
MAANWANGINTEYESRWYMADFWPGEYPPRFSVMKDGVELLGRAEMKLTSPKNVVCPVPNRATFSPWNFDRNQADNLLYWVVTKVSTVTITEDFTVHSMREIDDTEVMLDLKKDDVLDYLVYQSEGFALFSYKDENYSIDSGSFEGKAKLEENSREDDLWLSLPAEGGSYGWVLFKDALEVDGIKATDIEGFGIANDLPDPAALSLEGVTFHSGSADLTDASKQILDELAMQLRQVGDTNYEIAGYTDSLGRSDTNQKLSQKRADAVVDYLKNDAFIGEAQLTAVGYGEEDQIADNATPEGRAKNRRVELQVLTIG